MIEFLDGLGWAAVHVSALKIADGCNTNYYLAGSVLLIGSILALIFADSNR